MHFRVDVGHMGSAGISGSFCNRIKDRSYFTKGRTKNTAWYCRKIATQLPRGYSVDLSPPGITYSVFSGDFAALHRPIPAAGQILPGFDR
jgi:hypothetical protein